MKIVFSSNSSWSIYNFRRNLLYHLSLKGYDLILIAPPGEYLDKLRDLGYKTDSIRIDSSSTGIFSNLRLLLDLFRLYKLEKPDLVLHNAIKPNIYGALVCRWLNIPVINNISGLGSMFMNRNVYSYLGKIFYRVSQKKVNRVFFQNSSDLSLFIENNIVNKHQCVLIPGSGIDLERFKPKENILKDEKIKFCFVGRLLGDKGIFEYICAAKKIKSKYLDTEFYILGELYLQNPTSVSQSTLDEWINQRIVIFLGKTDSVEDELYKFDCIVLPSYREGLSRVLLEAASMAIPIITTNVPGCREVVEDNKNGFLCKVKDSDDLSRQMEKIIGLSIEERKQMGLCGRVKVEKEFDEKVVIQQYLEAISEIERSRSKPFNSLRSK